MCDTIAIVRKKAIFFAKNSDRDPNEAQLLEWRPAQEHPAGSKLKCTWIEIPQAERTHAVLISRPFWMWGAEMGTNEHGVVIGNEAVFTKQPYAKTGLTGMDILRLALERADSAERACEVIVELLEIHGQGGGCGFENRDFTYHNSFMIADPNGAYVLETAGKLHAKERVEGTRPISNCLTIGAFAEKHGEYWKTRISGCRTRMGRMHHLASKTLGAQHLFAALRDHGARYSNPSYRWTNGGMNAACMHGGGILASAQTTGSWVTEILNGEVRHWVTATAAPCTSVFKPVRIDQPLDLGSPQDKADDSLWWRHERFQRSVMRNPEPLRDCYVPERNALEAEWTDSPPDPAAAFARGDELLAKWSDAVAKRSVEDTRPGHVKRYWDKRNRLAGVSLF
ncbi:MAG: acyl-CoA--6-aminopenicillanic acid acyltransferase [Candidatus Hydrogenedentes bacterium]|nr:acyl-CoA--6-aminopenicillanic acid acyltransferase [Candidatus Hydrogenedentota bacterium]